MFWCAQNVLCVLRSCIWCVCVCWNCKMTKREKQIRTMRISNIASSSHWRLSRNKMTMMTINLEANAAHREKKTNEKRNATRNKTTISIVFMFQVKTLCRCAVCTINIQSGWLVIMRRKCSTNQSFANQENHWIAQQNTEQQQQPSRKKMWCGEITCVLFSLFPPWLACVVVYISHERAVRTVILTRINYLLHCVKLKIRIDTITNTPDKWRKTQARNHKRTHKNKQ